MNISTEKIFGVGQSSFSDDGMAKFQDRKLDIHTEYKVHLVLANGKPGSWMFSFKSRELIWKKKIIPPYTWLWILISLLILSILMVVLYIFRRYVILDYFNLHNNSN